MSAAPKDPQDAAAQAALSEPGALRPGGRPRPRQRPLAVAILWFMRIGILAMLSVAVAMLYARYHQSDEQIELRRYVEVDIEALSRVEGPILENMGELLRARSLTPADARRTLVDQLMPDLVRLRKLAEAPVHAAKTPQVRALANEYRAVVDDLIDACRTAVRAIDDPKLAGREGLAQVQAAYRRAAERGQTWREHVAAASAGLRLTKRPTGSDSWPRPPRSW